MANTTAEVKFLSFLAYDVNMPFRLGHWWSHTFTHCTVTHPTSAYYAVVLGASGVDERCGTVHGTSSFVRSIRLFCLPCGHITLVVVPDSRSY